MVVRQENTLEIEFMGHYILKTLFLSQLDSTIFEVSIKCNVNGDFA